MLYLLKALNICWPSEWILNIHFTRSAVFRTLTPESVCLESLPLEKGPLKIYTLLKIYKNINDIYIYTSENAEGC